MNDCKFYGKVVETPLLSKTEGGADVARIVLSTDTFRKSKNGDKIKERNYLTLEAWDSAALTLEKYCLKGDFLLVTARARNQLSDIVFRINEFKIFNNIQQEQPIEE